MRISDWSSDVCSSDLFGRRCKPSRATFAGEAKSASPSSSLGQRRGARPNDHDHDERRHRDLSQGLGARTARRTRPWLPLSSDAWRSEEHTSELQSLMRISYAVFCLKKKTKKNPKQLTHTMKDT